MTIPITGLTLAELTQKITDSYNQPRFRAEQIYSWAVKGTEITDMRNIPNTLKDELSKEFTSTALTLTLKKEEKRTDTIKYLFTTNDNITIESVALIYSGRLTVCVSSQAGCRMGCKFCVSGENGLIRGLTAAEIIAQPILISKDQSLPVSNIVLMGSGEPLDNYDAVRRFIRLCGEEKGLNIGIRHITLSTCGIIPGIKRLTNDDLGVNLSLSLHCAIPEIRKTIMPVENAYSITDVIEVCKEYRKKSGRRITCEYAVIEGINDTEACAKAIYKLLAGTDMTVNVIDYNEKASFKAKNKRGAAEEFANKLKNLKINYTIRRKLGSDINAACGQLKAGYGEKR